MSCLKEKIVYGVSFCSLIGLFYCGENADVSISTVQKNNKKILVGDEEYPGLPPPDRIPPDDQESSVPPIVPSKAQPYCTTACTQYYYEIHCSPGSSGACIHDSSGTSDTYPTMCLNYNNDSVAPIVDFSPPIDTVDTSCTVKCIKEVTSYCDERDLCTKDPEKVKLCQAQPGLFDQDGIEEHATYPSSGSDNSESPDCKTRPSGVGPLGQDKIPCEPTEYVCQPLRHGEIFYGQETCATDLEQSSSVIPLLDNSCQMDFGPNTYAVIYNLACIRESDLNILYLAYDFECHSKTPCVANPQEY